MRQAFSAPVIFGIGLFENKLAGDIGYWVVAATVSLGGLCCAAVWLRHRSASALSRTSLWTLLALALVAIIAAPAVPDRMAGYFVLAEVGLLAAALLIPATSDALRLLAGLSLAGGGSVIAAPAVGELASGHPAVVDLVRLALGLGSALTGVALVVANRESTLRLATLSAGGR